MTSPKPKVLMVSTGYPRSDGDVFGCFIADNAEAMVRQGLASVAVLAPHAQGYPMRCLQRGVSVFRCPYFPKGSVAYGGGIPTNLKRWSCRLQLPFFLVAMALGAIAMARRFDMIHAHWGASGWLAWAAARLWRKPLAVSYHGSDLHGQGLLFKVSQAIARRADLNICVTEEQGRRLGTPHEVISYGIDLERFKEPSPQKEQLSETNLGDKRFRFCYVGYLIPLKRVDAIISAMSELPRHVTLSIAGDGPCRAELEAKVTALKLQQRVSFLGKLPYHRIQEVFLNSDAHLLVSEREGRPNVILQAMACGIPSLASAVGGIPEQIVDGTTGELLDPCLGDLSARMRAWAESPQRVQHKGQRARLRIEKMGISSDEIARKHHLLFHKLLSERLAGL